MSLVYVNLFAKDLRHNHSYCVAIGQIIIQASQITLPRRGSSHSFCRHKKSIGESLTTIAYLWGLRITNNCVSTTKTTNGGSSREETVARMLQSEIVVIVERCAKACFRTESLHNYKICKANNIRTKRSQPRRHKLKVV